MPVGYHHLTHAERCPIHALLHRGWSKREIARDPGRDPGTISRETLRHRGQRGDRHQQADRQATARRQEASAVPRKRTPERWAVAAGRLQEGWSPEQIAGWVRLPGEVIAGKEWIYEHVRADRQAGGARYRCRRRRGKKPNGRGGRPAGRGHIPDRVDLAERPAVVAAKCRIGDWELEPIMGARHRGALVSAVDRGSKFRFLEWVDGKTASAVTEAITRRMGPVRDRVHTGTADHGKEFARHREIAQKLDAGCYFATPYHSWERGRNEHTNGLVRPYFPKGTDFRRVTPAPVRAVENRLHRRPRKVLGYRTPAEVFARGLAPPGRGWRSPDRPRHSGDSPERLRSASWCRFRPCLGRWLRSGSLAVEMAAIRGRKEALEAWILQSPPRSLPSGYALIPGSRRGCTSDWSRGRYSLKVWTQIAGCGLMDSPVLTISDDNMRPRTPAFTKPHDLFRNCLENRVDW